MLAETIERPASGSGVAATWRSVALRRGALVVGLLCAVWGVALGVGAARASAETIVGFDNLSASEPVTNQYEAQGLRLGSAAEFSQKSPHEHEGDCGPPTVRKEEPGVAAASPPNDAALPMCISASTEFSGTYGALLGRPGNRLGVEVRLLVAAGVPPEEVELVAYDGSGHELAGTKGKATDEGWLHMSVTLTTAQIRYFEIRTINAYNAAVPVGIDNLSFEQPNEGTVGGGGGATGGGATPPSPPTPPSASLSLQTPNPTPGETLTLNGGASQPGSGRIISYGWDFNGDGKIDTSTGTNPIAHVMLGPGAHTIGLTVTNANGEHSTTKFGLTLPPTGPKIHPPDGGEGECQPTLEIGDAHLLAECIQKLGGGYVIEGSVQINGMTVVPREGFLKIRTIKDYAIDGTATQLYGAQVYIELLNTPIGDMVLGERDLEAEPMDLETQSALNQFKLNYHGLRAPGAHAAAKTDEDAADGDWRGQTVRRQGKGESRLLPSEKRAERMWGTAGRLPTGGADRRLPHQQRAGAVRRAGGAEPEAQ